MPFPRPHSATCRGVLGQARHRAVAAAARGRCGRAGGTWPGASQRAKGRAVHARGETAAEAAERNGKEDVAALLRSAATERPLAMSQCGCSKSSTTDFPGARHFHCCGVQSCIIDSCISANQGRRKEARGRVISLPFASPSQPSRPWSRARTCTQVSVGQTHEAR